MKEQIVLKYSRHLNAKVTVIYCLLFLLIQPLSANAGRVLKVGPGEEFIFPSVAAKFANDGDTIEIDAKGMYAGDEVIWKQNDLVIKGVNGRPVIKGTHNLANGKALWIVKGNNTTIDNIEFSHASVNDHNGAGVRVQGKNLVVRHCLFRDNENGILAGSNPKSKIIIEYSEFSRNGFGKGRTHNVYIGKVGELDFQFNYSHGAIVGHNLKSRALKNYILYNRIMDGATGNSSYVVDIPNGGLTVLVGNQIQQGARAENWAIVAYGEEGLRNKDHTLYLVNNTIVNNRGNGVFLNLKQGATVKAVNNIFAGKGKLATKPLDLGHNLREISLSMFVDAAKFDYRLKPDSPAIDKGVAPGAAGKFSLNPKYEYVHRVKKALRKIEGKLDFGALEYHSKMK